MLCATTFFSPLFLEITTTTTTDYVTQKLMDSNVMAAITHLVNNSSSQATTKLDATRAIVRLAKNGAVYFFKKFKTIILFLIDNYIEENARNVIVKQGGLDVQQPAESKLSYYPCC